MRKWLQDLRVGYFVGLLAVLALLGLAGRIESRAGSRENDAASYFLGRSLDYSTYVSGNEASLADLDLWDKKVRDGLTRNQAMVYVANRPGRTSSAPADSASLLVAAARRAQSVGRTKGRLGVIAVLLSLIGIGGALWIRIDRR